MMNNKRITGIQIRNLIKHMMTNYNNSLLLNKEMLYSIIKHEADELWSVTMVDWDLNEVYKHLANGVWVENITY